jgi:hypothetical protein
LSKRGRNNCFPPLVSRHYFDPGRNCGIGLAECQTRIL